LDAELMADPVRRAQTEAGLFRTLARDEASLRFADAMLKRFDAGTLSPEERRILGEDRQRYEEWLQWCEWEYRATLSAAHHLGSLPD
jgi:hypothetical protein